MKKPGPVLKAWQGWPNTIWIDNGLVQLGVAMDIGPRVLHFGRVGGANAFFLFPATLGRRGGKSWRSTGGHRFWYAPEKKPYPADNDPVAWNLKKDGSLELVQKTEKGSRLQKSLTLKLAKSKSRVVVTHRLFNRGSRTQRVAGWGLSVFKTGGRVLLARPAAPNPQGLLPDGAIVTWPYTDLAEGRWSFGRRFIELKARRGRPRPQKLGLWSPKGWIAYIRGKELVVIRSKPLAGDYPDFGCNVETYTNGKMVELETLGPLRRLAPGQSLVHEETWDLALVTPGLSETALSRKIEAMVKGG